MKIEDALRFVKCAVAKKGFVPTLTHFCIKAGRIYGYDGKLCLSSPINIDFDCAPKADTFLSAIGRCEETTELHVTTAGRLSVRSGKFKAFVDLLQEPFPELAPAGEVVPLTDVRLLPALKILEPFAAEDASRPWAAAVLLRGQTAAATNNVVIVEYWLGCRIPYVMAIPRRTVQEMIRIGEDPIAMQCEPYRVTFHYSGERWLQTSLNSIEWPDINRLLDGATCFERIATGGEAYLERLFTGAEAIKPFVDEYRRAYLQAGAVCTVDGADAETRGASHDVEGQPDSGVFNVDHLLSLQGVATVIDFSRYPAPCGFLGDGLRGAIVGIRR